MIRISQEEAKELIRRGKIKLKCGRYPELHITSRQKKGKRKNYYVPDYLGRYLK